MMTLTIFTFSLGVLREDTLSQFLFIIWMDYVLRTPIYLKKENVYGRVRVKKK